MSDNIINSDFNVEKPLNYISVIELIVDRLATNSDQNCFIDCTLDRKWTKKQVLDSSLNFADYLITECQVSTGDVICFAANNSDIHAVGLIGSLAAGLVYCCLPHSASIDEIQANILSVKPTIVVCFENNLAQVNKLCQAISFVKKLLITDKQLKSELNNENTIQSLEEIFQIPRDISHVLPVKSELNDPATYVLSSGSTGQPKAIIRTNQNHLATCEQMQHWEITEMTSSDIVLSSNFCHMSGQRSIVQAIAGGAQLAIVRIDEHLEDVYENIHKFNITTAFLIPTQLNYLVKNPFKFDKNYLKSLRDVMTGAAPISQATFDYISNTYAFEKFRVTYGMTEVGFATMTPVSESKTVTNNMCIGKVCPNTQMKVIDEFEKALPANTLGQICIGGPQVTPGYLNLDSENSKLFTRDGYLKSGDIGYYDQNRYFYLEGRIKDIINVERTIVTPAEIENVLVTHRDVINAAVFGIPDEDRGEIPMAFVSLVVDSRVTPKELVDYVDSRVNYYKKLRGGVRVLNTFPLTSLKKINRGALRKMLNNS